MLRRLPSESDLEAPFTSPTDPLRHSLHEPFFERQREGQMACPQSRESRNAQLDRRFPGPGARRSLSPPITHVMRPVSEATERVVEVLSLYHPQNNPSVDSFQTARSHSSPSSSSLLLPESTSVDEAAPPPSLAYSNDDRQQGYDRLEGDFEAEPANEDEGGLEVGRDDAWRREYEVAGDRALGQQRNNASDDVQGDSSYTPEPQRCDVDPLRTPVADPACREPSSQLGDGLAPATVSEQQSPPLPDPPIPPIPTNIFSAPLFHHFDTARRIDPDGFDTPDPPEFPRLAGDHEEVALFIGEFLQLNALYLASLEVWTTELIRWIGVISDYHTLPSIAKTVNDHELRQARGEEPEAPRHALMVEALADHYRARYSTEPIEPMISFMATSVNLALSHGWRHLSPTAADLRHYFAFLHQTYVQHDRERVLRQAARRVAEQAPRDVQNRIRAAEEYAQRRRMAEATKNMEQLPESLRSPIRPVAANAEMGARAADYAREALAVLEVPDSQSIPSTTLPRGRMQIPLMRECPTDDALLSSAHPSAITDIRDNYGNGDDDDDDDNFYGDEPGPLDLAQASPASSSTVNPTHGNHGDIDGDNSSFDGNEPRPLDLTPVPLPMAPLPSTPTNDAGPTPLVQTTHPAPSPTHDVVAPQAPHLHAASEAPRNVAASPLPPHHYVAPHTPQHRVSPQTPSYYHIARRTPPHHATPQTPHHIIDQEYRPPHIASPPTPPHQYVAPQVPPHPPFGLEQPAHHPVAPQTPYYHPPRHIVAPQPTPHHYFDPARPPRHLDAPEIPHRRIVDPQAAPHRHHVGPEAPLRSYGTVDGEIAHGDPPRRSTTIARESLPRLSIGSGRNVASGSSSNQVRVDDQHRGSGAPRASYERGVDDPQTEVMRAVERMSETTVAPKTTQKRHLGRWFTQFNWGKGGNGAKP